MADALISIQGVKKTYQTGETRVHALRGIDLTIASGEFASIAGPSGSGKSTMLNLLGCLDTIDEGEIVIGGQALSHLNRRDQAEFRRQYLGFIFQSYNLIPVLTAYENVAMALELLGLSNREIKDRTMAILKDVDLEGKEDRLPSRLSGGQQQRVAVARALVKQPRLILADEPTANLDSHTGESILDLMKDLNQKHNTTFVFSTHDKMVMDRAHRLIMLHDGAILSDEVRP